MPLRQFTKAVAYFIVMGAPSVVDPRNQKTVGLKTTSDFHEDFSHMLLDPVKYVFIFHHTLQDSSSRHKREGPCERGLFCRVAEPGLHSRVAGFEPAGMGLALARPRWTTPGVDYRIPRLMVPSQNPVTGPWEHLLVEIRFPHNFTLRREARLHMTPVGDVRIRSNPDTCFSQLGSALERSVLLRHHFRVAGVTGPHISPRHGPIRWHLPLSAHIDGTPRFRFASASQESLRSTRERCSPQPGREQPEKSPGNPLRPPPWRNRRDFSRRSHCPKV